ncbi:MAG: hypothetical protein AAF656_07280 [Planctomycetota bacterium]
MPATIDPPAPVDVPPPSPPVTGDGGDGGSGDGDGRWVTVGRYRSTFEAHLARLKLQSEEIDCVILEENVANLQLFGVLGGGAVLQVPDELAESARSILAGIGTERFERDDDVEWTPIARFSTGHESSLAAAVLETHGFRVGIGEVGTGPNRGASLLHVPEDEVSAARGVLKSSPAGHALLSEAEMQTDASEKWTRPPWVGWLLVLLLASPLLMAGVPGVLVALLAIAGWCTFTGMRDNPRDFR